MSTSSIAGCRCPPTRPRDLARPLLVGLLLAGLIAAFVPDDYFSSMTHRAWLTRLIMLLVGMPLYVCSTASVPIAYALLAKGLSPGAVLVFLVAGPGANAAGIATVWNTMGRRAAVVYVMTITVTSLVSGWLLDVFAGALQARGLQPEHCGWHLPMWLTWGAFAVLAGTMGVALWQQWFARTPAPCHDHDHAADTDATTTSCCATNAKGPRTIMPYPWRTVVQWIVIFMAGLVVGVVVRGYVSPRTDGSATTTTVAPATAAEYTCSMHPQIRQSKPGRCPICGMDLIPVRTEDDQASSGVWRVTLSPAAQARAQIETALVERRFVPVSVPLTGKVVLDETRLAYITTRVPGRLDKLYVDYTGVNVKQNDHLVYLYSQELYVLQAEYLIALRSGQKGSSAGRDRLLLAGLTEQQVSELERTGEPQLYETIYSPLSGTVVEKNGVEGMYVDVGTRIFTVADLSKLWVLLDAYESDLPWLRYGQTATFTTEAYPGVVFTGRVAFIAPVVDEMTRTVHVRLNVDNPRGALKPGFLVRAAVNATVAGTGQVIEPDLVHKWMCPMHPEVVRDGPAACPLCGMPLASVATLGYVEPTTNVAPLIIPATAPLITGKRAVVYVADPLTNGVYEGREIVLGPRANDFYLVDSGVREGERVVVNGSFQIDSTLQIRAQRSMMTPASASATAVGATTTTADAASARLTVPPAFHAQLAQVLSAYLAMHQALSADDLTVARTQARQASTALTSVDMSALDRAAHAVWMPLETALRAAFDDAVAAKDLATARRAYHAASQNIITAVRRFGTGRADALHLVHCPMAFDNTGADWLQADAEIANPYFGAAMLRCGEITEDIL